jgi:hypothetical protein
LLRAPEEGGPSGGCSRRHTTHKPPTANTLPLKASKRELTQAEKEKKAEKKKLSVLWRRRGFVCVIKDLKR